MSMAYKTMIKKCSRFLDPVFDLLKNSPSFSNSRPKMVVNEPGGLLAFIGVRYQQTFMEMIIICRNILPTIPDKAPVSPINLPANNQLTSTTISTRTTTMDIDHTRFALNQESLDDYFLFMTLNIDILEHLKV